MRQYLLEPPHIQQMAAGGAADEVGGKAGADRADDAMAKDFFGLHGQSEEMPPDLRNPAATSSARWSGAYCQATALIGWHRLHNGQTLCQVPSAPEDHSDETAPRTRRPRLVRIAGKPRGRCI